MSEGFAADFYGKLWIYFNDIFERVTKILTINFKEKWNLIHSEFYFKHFDNSCCNTKKIFKKIKFIIIQIEF